MADPAAIEALQAERRAHALAATRERAVRWLLLQLEPTPTPPLPYVEVLRRLQNALATEFHRIREEKDDGLLRPSDGGVDQPDAPVPGP